MKIGFIFSKTKDFQYPENYPGTYWYGFWNLKKDYGDQLGYIVTKERSLFYFLFLPLEIFLAKKTGIGFRLHQIITKIKIKEINTYQVIVAAPDSIALPLALLKSFKLIQPKIIYLSIGLADSLKNLENKHSLIFKFYKFLLRRVDKLIVYSKQEMGYLNNLIPQKSVFLKLGADTEFFHPNPKIPEQNLVVAVGRDPQRDWPTLIETAEKLSHLKFIIITTPSLIKNQKIPSNLTVKFNVPYEEIRDLYWRAKLVVLPTLKNRLRMSGQLSFLDALASKKAVIITDDSYLIDTYELKNGENVLLFEAENSKDLISKINDLLKNKGLRLRIAEGGFHKVKNKYNLKNYIRKFQDIIERL